MPVLRNINLTIEDGEFMVLVGASGCGKSTLLRLIAGLESVTAGNIWMGDRRLNDLPPKDRNIAMVFQNYALYPHMRVYDNLAFGLRRAGVAASESGTSLRWVDAFLTSITRPLPKGWRYWSAQERAIDQRVRTVAKMLQIDDLLQRFPRQLSGGQKQRVALGRAMARNPAVFLMDEPLSNLDAQLRTETRAQIVNLQRQLGITTIYVTHDQVEAMTMGDRIAVMHAGQIQQVAHPLELYNHPANQYVAGFIGSPPMNFLPVQVTTATTIAHYGVTLTLPDHWQPAIASYIGSTVTLGVRPEHWQVGRATANALKVQVQRVEALGSETFLTVVLVDTPGAEASRLQVRLHPDATVNEGDILGLTVAPERIHLFDPATGLAICA
ncbi:MAG: ABC transporter ATP-binding protein [Cyanobacteria bacterium]|nr:ABC transporter ATP-binding protein [Cyanobacteriota bacterium]